MSTDGITRAWRVLPPRAADQGLPTGDVSAFMTESPKALDDWVTTLFEEHRSALFRYLVLSFGRPADAEEVAQEAFLRLYRFVRDGGAVTNARGWLFRVAHNIAVDRVDRGRWHQSGDDEWWEALMQRVRDTAPSPEQTVLGQEQDALFAKEVRLLSPQQRRCLLLRVEGLRHREIAETLGISMATVAQALRRGLQRLMRELDDAHPQ